MTQSGELSISRSRKGRSTHSQNSGGSNSRMMMKQQQPIVAVEPDGDLSSHRRIDQGLIDASNEAQNQVLYPPTSAASQKSTTSWWGFSTAASNTPPPQPSQVAPINSLNVSLPTAAVAGGGVKASADGAKHRRTVSYKGTYRVP